MLIFATISRLGANSLLDIVVFGRACAHHINETMDKGKPHQKMPEDAGLEGFEALDAVRRAEGPKHVSEIRKDMQRVMQSDAAVFRTQVCLIRSVRRAVINLTNHNFPAGIARGRRKEDA